MTVMMEWSRPGWGRYGGAYDPRVAEVRTLQADLQALCHGVEEITASQEALCQRLERIAAAQRQVALAQPAPREVPTAPRVHEGRFRTLEFPAQEEP